jgi:predicted RNA methylase
MTQRYKRIDYCLKNIQDMINDKKRNQFYKKLFHGKLKDKVIVDVGFGTGLLSFLALEEGAKKVISYEQNKELYLLGLKVLKSLGLEEKIQLINDRFTTKHLKGFEDVIIHEIFSEDLWGEYLYYSLKNSPIPIIPNIYKLEVSFRPVIGKESRYTTPLREDKTFPYRFDPGILDINLIRTKKEIIEEEILRLPKEMPVTFISKNEINPIDGFDYLLGYEIDTNKIDFPEDIKIDLNLPLGDYMLYFKYSFGDENNLFTTTDDYEGKSWDQFVESGNPVKLTVTDSKFYFYQSIVNGHYYFGICS